MSDSKFSYEINETSNYAIISVKEDQLGGSDALEFSEMISSLKSKDINFIICDLDKVILMNSSGLGMLVSSLSTLKKVNVDFVLTSIPDKIMNLLTMTHLDKVFKIFANIEEAVKYLK